MAKLNLYGDKANFLAAGHGADIASQRADDLDLMAIEFVNNTPSAFAIDVACGAGGQAVRLAMAGAMVVATDIGDMGEAVQSTATANSVADRVGFVRMDMRNLSELRRFGDNNQLDQVDVIVCQRAIHYLPFNEALVVVGQMGQMLAPEGRIYLSASGIHSELGEDYPGAQTPLENRFAELSPTMREKHGIHGPVCLYSEEDLEWLLAKGGLTVERVFSSSFGNIKAVAKHV